MRRDDHGSEWRGRDPEKDAIRDRIWSLLEAEGVARFPGARGRIPNFRGAEAAADRLDDVPAWRAARHLKANPDLPQLPVRIKALRQGKIVYMAEPRLASDRPFRELDPARLGDRIRAAASIGGAARLGRPLPPEAVPPLDLVVAGSVAVTRDGARLGKGGGYSDLEFALLQELGLITPDTVVVTTVHPLQIVPSLPMTPHDLPVDWIVTPDEAIATHTRYPRPAGIDPDLVQPDQWETIPLLRRLARHR